MSVKSFVLSAAVVVATIGPAFASSGTTFLNNEQGYVPHPEQSRLTRAQVLTQLEQDQQRSRNPSLQVGEYWSYPPMPAGPSSDKPMTHRGAAMPGGQGMMPDHPHK
ncbi:MAG TPA: hypothetical protein PK177_23385 [Burkholderiaceae bacterium]|nr:hypothetical protein [Burkholderiaceae bacterium]